MLHSLSLRLPNALSTDTLETVVKLLTPRLPGPPLHTITLVFDSVFWSANHSHNVAQLEEISGEEYCALYHKIDSILGDQQCDEGNATVTYLTLKASYGLPRPIVDDINNLFQAELPDLHRKGRLRMELSVWGKQLPTCKSVIRC